MYEDSYHILKNSGFDFFDIYTEKSKNRIIEAKNRQIENIKIGIDEGVGVRGVKGLSTLYSSSSDPSEKSVYGMSKFISDVSNVKNGMNSIKSNPSASVDSYGGYPAELEKVREIFDIFNTKAYKFNQIKQVSLTYSDKLKKISIINEKGVLLRETRIYTTLFVEITARKGDVIQTVRRPFSALGGFDLFNRIDFSSIAEESVSKLLKLIESPKLEAKQMCVILSSEAGGTMIHEAVGHGLEADLVYESMSVYKDRLNTNVANEKITVVDDSTKKFTRGSFIYDDEGTQAQNTVLIKNGILKNYMFDKTYAKLAEMSSTGNGRRESFKFAPIVRMSNTYILPGSDDPDDIIASVDYGLLVKHMGGGQVNPITGDFVFEVMEGYLIKNGKIGHMVRGATLVGNGPKVLLDIDMVGSDFGTEVGTCGKGGQGVPVTDGEPTLKIPNILVGGSKL